MIRADFQSRQQFEANGVWHWFPVETNGVHLACDKIAAASDAVFLRAADALHLACAVAQGFQEVYTHDRHMLVAPKVLSPSLPSIAENGLQTLACVGP